MFDRLHSGSVENAIGTIRLVSYRVKSIDPSLQLLDMPIIECRVSYIAQKIHRQQHSQQQTMVDE